MKKCYLLVLSIGLSLSSLAQGGLEAGFALGVPVGDARLVIKTNYVIEAGYLFTVANKVAIGAKAGYSFMTGEEVAFSDFNEDAPNQNYLTVAASGLIEVTNRLWLGADLGYGFGANGFDQNDQVFGIPVENVNGFYYSPRLRYAFTNRFGIEAAYRSILIDSYDASSVTAGVVFVLTK